MTRRSIRGVLEALDAVGHAAVAHDAARAVVDATLCAAGADGALVTSLSDGVPVGVWTWPGDFFTGPCQEAFEAATAISAYPLVTHTRSGPGWALRLSDQLSERDYRATPCYAEVLKDLSIPRQLAFSVPTVTGRSLCVALGRHGPDFTDAECARVNALRGPLGVAARRAPRPGTTGPEVESGRSLSRREQEVLELAATGLSDVQIGRRLGITPRTVGKHLEHLYRKSHTSNRTEAAARLLAPGPPPPVLVDAFTDGRQGAGQQQPSPL